MNCVYKRHREITDVAEMQNTCIKIIGDKVEKAGLWGAGGAKKERKSRFVPLQPDAIEGLSWECNMIRFGFLGKLLW